MAIAIFEDAMIGLLRLWKHDLSRKAEPRLVGRLARTFKLATSTGP